MTRVFLLMSLLAASTFGATSQVQSTTNDQTSHTDGPVALTLNNLTTLRAVLRIAEENKIPLGIVLGTHPLLCTEQGSVNINAKSFKEAFSQIVEGTGYTTTIEGGVYVLTAPDVTEHEAKVLNFRFDRFSATNSTMNDAGQLLAGYIKTTIEGAQSFATASSFGQLSKTFSVRMQSASTREIANRIVVQNGKGVWVFRPIGDTLPQSGVVSPIEILGYADNSLGLDQLSCSVGIKRNK